MSTAAPLLVSRFTPNFICSLPVIGSLMKVFIKTVQNKLVSNREVYHSLFVIIIVGKEDAGRLEREHHLLEFFERASESVHPKLF